VVTEPQIRELFNQIANGEAAPSRVDAQLAFRRGRARLRWRRFCLAATPVAAAAAAAVVVLAMAAGPARPVGQAASGHGGPAAPRQFHPLIPGVTFGWLPTGESFKSGGVTGTESYMRTESYMNAGHLGPGRSLDVYARGQCHLTGSASGLNCPGSKLQISQRAPDIAGHRAFWTGPGPGIVWQYARGGWAWQSIPASNLSAVLHNEDLLHQALKIARHIRYDVTTPLVFPAQFSGLPSQWQVHNISYYLPDSGLLRADEYMLTTGSSRFHKHVGALGVWTDAPYIIVHPAPPDGTCAPHDPHSQNTPLIINGYRVVLKRMHIGRLPVQELCGAQADGLWFDIQEFGSHPSIDVATLFKQHMKLLGTNPANWTSHPLK
jgi:hypothetical protein